MPNELLTRTCFNIEDVEVREENGKTTIAGYAAMFEKLSVPIYDFREKIRAGAFLSSLSKNNVRALWNHNSDYVLGSTKAGTLTLSEDTKGLRFELAPPDTTAGRDAVVSIKRGDVDGMSFGFRVLKQEWDEKDPKNIIRTLVEVDLREVSPTAFPAYPDTKVKVRTVADDYQEYSERQKELAAKDAAIIDLLKKKTRLHELS
jgi:HK97 family phage prohead protease